MYNRYGEEIKESLNENEESFNVLTDTEKQVAQRNRRDLGVEGAIDLFKNTIKMWEEEIQKESNKKVKEMYFNRIKHLQAQMDWLKDGGKLEHSTKNNRVIDETINKRAEEHFGTTNDLKECGYIMHDGKLLDFSGKMFGGSSGVRVMDHREVNDAFDGDISMEDFINNGNIRFIESSNSLTMSNLPTNEQFKVIEKIMNRSEGIQIECLDDANDWDSDDNFYKEFSSLDDFKKVKRDILDFYRGLM